MKVPLEKACGKLVNGKLQNQRLSMGTREPGFEPCSRGWTSKLVGVGMWRDFWVDDTGWTVAVDDVGAEATGRDWGWWLVRGHGRTSVGEVLGCDVIHVELWQVRERKDAGNIGWERSYGGGRTFGGFSLSLSWDGRKLHIDCIIIII